MLIDKTVHSRKECRGADSIEDRPFPLLSDMLHDAPMTEADPIGAPPLHALARLPSHSILSIPLPHSGLPSAITPLNQSLPPDPSCTLATGFNPEKPTLYIFGSTPGPSVRIKGLCNISLLVCYAHQRRHGLTRSTALPHLPRHTAPSPTTVSAWPAPAPPPVSAPPHLSPARLPQPVRLLPRR
jgi:hypothetical protein